MALPSSASLVDNPLAQEGYDIMAAVFEVHHHLGGGLLEEVYQESLEIELSMRCIPFIPCQELRLFYKDRVLKRKYIPDFLLCDRIVVEIKAVKQLAPEHEAQLINYMRITRMPVGYLVNFGPISKAEWRRFVLSEFISSTPNPH